MIKIIIRNNLKNKLKNRIDEVFNSHIRNYQQNLKLFFDFARENNILQSLINELDAHNFDFNEYASLESNRRFIPYPESYLDKIYVCYSVIRKFSLGEYNFMSYCCLDFPNGDNNKLHKINEIYFKPFIFYIIEKIEDGNAVLYLLSKYKYKVEWFHKDDLYDLYQSNTGAGEENLTANLREFLYDQGIDYPFSTPNSPSGRADIIALLDTTDPLVLEIKLFLVSKGYGKSYIRKGLVQAYRYALDYNKPIGYLVIFDLDNYEIQFENNTGEPIKEIRLGDKTIFILVIKIRPLKKTASQLKKANPYIISDEYLCNIEEIENKSNSNGGI